MPLRLNLLDDQLVVAAHGEDVYAAAREHGDAVPGLKFHEARRAFEERAADLRFPLLQREVAMPAAEDLRAGDFPRDPDVVELFPQQAGDGVVQLGNAEDTPARREIKTSLSQDPMVALARNAKLTKCAGSR